MRHSEHRYVAFPIFGEYFFRGREIKDAWNRPKHWVQIRTRPGRLQNGAESQKRHNGWLLTLGFAGQHREVRLASVKTMMLLQIGGAEMAIFTLRKRVLRTGPVVASSNETSVNMNDRLSSLLQSGLHRDTPDVHRSPRVIRSSYSSHCRSNCTLLCFLLSASSGCTVLLSRMSPT